MRCCMLALHVICSAKIGNILLIMISRDCMPKLFFEIFSFGQLTAELFSKH